jgi:AcrR family transcriptional regulator
VATRLSGDERREHLLHVGVELLGRHGTDDISIDEIARAAGVSKGLLYHYFPTKDDFLLAVLDRSQAEMDQEFVRDRSLSASEQFDRDLDAFLRFVDDHAAGYLAVASARGREPRVQRLIEKRRRRRIDELVTLAAVLRGAPRDEVRTPVLEAAIEGWLGFSETVIVRWLRDRAISRQEVHVVLRRALFQVLTEAPRGRAVSRRSGRAARGARPTARARPAPRA